MMTRSPSQQRVKMWVVPERSHLNDDDAGRRKRTQTRHRTARIPSQDACAVPRQGAWHLTRSLNRCSEQPSRETAVTLPSPAVSRHQWRPELCVAGTRADTSTAQPASTQTSAAAPLQTSACLQPRRNAMGFSCSAEQLRQWGREGTPAPHTKELGPTGQEATAGAAPRPVASDSHTHLRPKPFSNSDC